MKNKLISGAENYGITLSDSQAEQFMNYMSLLREWNEKINLTAITEPEEVVTKHFLDSMSVYATPYVKDGTSVIDVGTGAGFPGLVMKIAKPGIKLTLLDSLAKRLNFLQTVCEETAIPDVEFVHSRAEDGGQNPNYREKFDVAIADSFEAVLDSSEINAVAIFSQRFAHGKMSPVMRPNPPLSVRYWSHKTKEGFNYDRIGFHPGPERLHERAGARHHRWLQLHD